jgi:hypothetical protein
VSSRPNFFVRTFPRTVRVVRRVWFIVYTIIAIPLIVVLMISLFNPASGGAKGTAVITNCNSDLKYRQCLGNFVSDDGTVRLTNVQVAGESGGQPGRRFTGYGDASDRSITIPSAGAKFTDIGASLALFVAWLALFYLVVYGPIRRRRRVAVA